MLPKGLKVEVKSVRELVEGQPIPVLKTVVITLATTSEKYKFSFLGNCGVAIPVSEADSFSSLSFAVEIPGRTFGLLGLGLVKVWKGENVSSHLLAFYLHNLEGGIEVSLSARNNKGVALTVSNDLEVFAVMPNGFQCSVSLGYDNGFWDNTLSEVEIISQVLSSFVNNDFKKWEVVGGVKPDLQ